MNDVELQSLYATIINTQIVEILIERVENPQVVFESLNSTGKELTDIELITNLLFMQIHDDNEQQRIYNAYWKTVEITLNSDKRSENFIKSFLSVVLERPDGLPKNRLYEIFKIDYLQNNINPGEVAMTISQYINVYRQIELIDAPANNQLKSALNDIYELKSVQPLPLLMVLLLKYNAGYLSIEHILLVIKLIETYIARRSLTGESSASHFRIFSSLAATVNGLNITAEILQAAFYYFANLHGAAKMPRNELVRATLLSKDFYNFANSKYFFEKIIFQIYGNEYNVGIENRTIEHIMPQTLTYEWRDYLGGTWPTVHATKVNVLGNLVLIPQRLNTCLGQRSFQKKKKSLIMDVEIFLRHHIQIYSVKLIKPFTGIAVQLTIIQIILQTSYLINLHYPKIFS